MSDSEYAKKKSRVALITGITGQDGSYLAEYLLSHPDCTICLLLLLDYLLVCSTCFLFCFLFIYFYFLSLLFVCVCLLALQSSTRCTASFVARRLSTPAASTTSTAICTRTRASFCTMATSATRPTSPRS